MNDRTFTPATAQVDRRNVILSGVASSAAALVPGTALGAGQSTSESAPRKVWLIPGAGRGLGLDIAKAALAAGHCVVATGRNPLKIAAAIGEQENLLSIKLDVTRPEDSQEAITAAVERFGRIDVLVNNAGNFYAGFFEELSPEQVRNQIETLLFGPMNVTRAALPVMRKQRAGLLLTISSTAGIVGGMFCSAYAAANSASKDGSSRSRQKSRHSAFVRCWSSPVSFALSCSRPTRRRTPSLLSRTMPSERKKRSLPGTA
jgi:NADP-dependent 3-hydroxy acid dehydrogenase YdfG